MKITPILCRVGTMDNYSYLITDEQSGISAIIDPSESAPIIEACRQQNIQPEYILNTHHHFDHTDSNLELKSLFHARIVGNAADSARIPGIDIGIKEGETFNLGETPAQIINADGHTIGHILWYFAKDKALFTGDVLFNLCIGGIFEGTIEQMWASLQKIKALPDDVMFYPGHEYTLYGARDALKISNNAPEVIKYLEQAQNNLKKGLPAGPYCLKDEKQCNPYLSAQSLVELEQRLGY